MSPSETPLQETGSCELTDLELAQVAGGVGPVVDDDDCELPPGDTPHDRINPAPMPTPVDSIWSSGVPGR